MNYEPLVSVVTPLYNSRDSIVKTVDSILNQSYSNIEVIIVDDLSTDGSVDIVRELTKRDDRIKLIMLEKKGGASVARNVAIENANGKYVAFLDSDDTWNQDKLTKQVGVMENKSYVFTYSNYSIFEGSNIIKKQKSPKEIDFKRLLKRNTIGCLTVVYNREIIKDLSIPKLDKRNDYALWLKALKPGYTGYLIDEDLANYFVSAKSLSRSKGKVNLVKYHYKMYREVLFYNRCKSLYYTLRNIFYNFYDKMRKDESYE